MLLHDSRRDARLDAAGDVVLLEAQDWRRWDRQQIAEALPLVASALTGGPGRFALAGDASERHFLERQLRNVQAERGYA
jgi:RNA polymerase sigma-70 factor (ECF subfamily)